MEFGIGFNKPIFHTSIAPEIVLSFGTKSLHPRVPSTVHRVSIILNIIK